MRQNVVILAVLVVVCALLGFYQRTPETLPDLTDDDLIKMLPHNVDAVAVVHGPFTVLGKNHAPEGLEFLTSVTVPILYEIRRSTTLCRHVKTVVAGVKVGKPETDGHNFFKWGNYGEFCSIVVLDSDSMQGLDALAMELKLTEVRMLRPGVVAYASSRSFIEHVDEPGLRPDVLHTPSALGRSTRLWCCSEATGFIQLRVEGDTVSVVYASRTESGVTLHKAIDEMRSLQMSRAGKEPTFEVRVTENKMGLSEASFPLNIPGGFVLTYGIAHEFGCWPEPP